MSTKYNLKSAKEINLFPSRRFSKTFLIKVFFVNNDKIDKFGLIITDIWFNH